MSTLTQKEQQEQRALQAQRERLAKLEAEQSLAEEKLNEMLERKAQTLRDKIDRLKATIKSKEALIEKANQDIAEALGKIDDLEAAIVEVLGDNPTEDED